jgi:hypothetical protein
MAEVKRFLPIVLILFLGIGIGLLAMYFLKYPTYTPTVTTTTTGPTILPGGQQQAGSETGTPITNPLTGETVGVKCPADYCLNPVQGAGNCPSWTGKTDQTYTEQECYDYPDSAASLVDCDAKRVIYYLICGVRKS